MTVQHDGAQQKATSVAGVYDVAFDRHGKAVATDSMRGLVLPASAGLVPSALLLCSPAPGEALGVGWAGVPPRGAVEARAVAVQVAQAVPEK